MLNASVQKKSAKGMRDLGVFLYNGANAPSDPEKGLKLLQSAAEAGSIQACRDLIRIHSESWYGFSQIDSTALYYHAKALVYARSLLRDTARGYGYSLITGNRWLVALFRDYLRFDFQQCPDKQKVDAKAIEDSIRQHLKAGANEGDLDAQYQTARSFLDSTRISAPDTAAAIAYMKPYMGNFNHPDMAVLWGQLLLTGSSILHRDTAEGIIWLMCAGRKGAERVKSSLLLPLLEEKSPEVAGQYDREAYLRLHTSDDSTGTHYTPWWQPKIFPREKHLPVTSGPAWAAYIKARELLRTSLRPDEDSLSILLLKAARGGVVAAMQLYAIMDRDSQDYWLKQAATGGNPITMIAYAHRMLDNNDIESYRLFVKKGQRLIDKGAEDGLPGPCAYLAIFAQNDEEKEKWALQAVKKGYWPLVAFLTTANLFQVNGNIDRTPEWLVKLDTKVKGDLLEKAALSGDLLGIMYKLNEYNKNSSNKNYEEEQTWQYIAYLYSGTSTNIFLENQGLGSLIGTDKGKKVLNKIQARAEKILKEVPKNTYDPVTEYDPRFYLK